MSRKITVNVWRGVVDNVKGLPKGWQYAVEDWDEINIGDGSRKHVTPQTVVVVVRGGSVEDVRGLPRGYTWQEKSGE